MIEKLPKDYNLRQFVEVWNVTFPFDYLWRKKYNVSFGSEVHRNMDFFDIKFDLQEDLMYKQLLKKIAKEKKQKSETFPDEADQLLKPLKYRVGQNLKKLSPEELDDVFNNLDLDQYNDIKI